MPKIRSVTEIAKKWGEVTPARSSQFEAGVRAPKEDWAPRTVAAESAFEEGIRNAISRKAFSKGVKEAGTEKWQRKTIEVGVGRWGTGVTAAISDYEKGFAPFADVIARTVLPPRFRKGDPRNIDRVRDMAKALHEAKIK